jgi:hypothetical protein
MRRWYAHMCRYTSSSHAARLKGYERRDAAATCAAVVPPHAVAATTSVTPIPRHPAACCSRSVSTPSVRSLEQQAKPQPSGPAGSPFAQRRCSGTLMCPQAQLVTLVGYPQLPLPQATTPRSVPLCRTRPPPAKSPASHNSVGFDERGMRTAVWQSTMGRTHAAIAMKVAVAAAAPARPRSAHTPPRQHRRLRAAAAAVSIGGGASGWRRATGAARGGGGATVVAPHRGRAGSRQSLHCDAAAYNWYFLFPFLR